MAKLYNKHRKSSGVIKEGNVYGKDYSLSKGGKKDISASSHIDGICTY